MKSHVSDQLELALCIYKDACAKFTADVSDLRDLDTLRSRVEERGLGFLTLDLPEFARSLEQALALGYIDPTQHFLLFRKRGRKGTRGPVPVFLRGLVSRLFDIETGGLYSEFPQSANTTHPSAFVEAIRQICLAFKKLEVECEPSKVRSAIEGFVLTERDLSAFSCDSKLRDRFDRVCAILWAPMLSSIKLDDLRPKHGPGATSDGISGNRKFRHVKWPERMEPYFPFLWNAYSISAFDSQEFQDVTFVTEELEEPVKVTPVPKTQKGPRIIAIESVATQFAQQAIKDKLYEVIQGPIDRSATPSPRVAYPSFGHVNFDDQSVNRRLALTSSLDRSFATIDLSEASDRVPLELAIRMFDSHPDLRDAILACRSTRAKLPDGTVIGPLRKFASMGSALCFPVEAMYFYTSCVEALLEVQGLPVTRDNVKTVATEVYVYGDDLLIPTQHAVAVLDHLQKYNCKVNRAKTFVNGYFRESCGLDAYLGNEVTPQYIRSLRPENRRQAKELISWVQTANLFHKRGFWSTAEHMYKSVERILGKLPWVPQESSALGRHAFYGIFDTTITRWNSKFQRLEIKAWIPTPVRRTDKLDGYAALQKCLNRNYEFSFEITNDPLHLERTELYGAVELQRRWV